MKDGVNENARGRAKPLPALADSRRARLFTLFALYAAQGAPEGLLYVAAPAWLAAQGVEAAAIGGYIAVILLPWSLKLVNGLVMDRFAFPAMGRRRPWLIGAQACLVAALVVYGMQAPDETLLALTVAGFLVNLAGAFQDVAIDGMAIDITPEAERARANGVMWGGKTLGIAAASFVTGHLVSTYGLMAGALATAAFVGLVMVLPLALRERAGEKRLPWTAGAARAETLDAQMTRWRPLVARLLAVVARPASLVFAAGVFAALIGYGLHTAFSPVLAVQRLGWEDAAYTRLAGAAGLAGGLFGVFASGWIADRLGPARALGIALAVMAVLHLAMAAAPALWPAPGVFAGYMIVYNLTFVLISVSLYANAMAISTRSVAATQFSIYMAVLNLGTAFGAQRLGGLEAMGGYEAAMVAVAAASLAGAGLFYGAARLERRAAA